MSGPKAHTAQRKLAVNAATEADACQAVLDAGARQFHDVHITDIAHIVKAGGGRNRWIATVDVAPGGPDQPAPLPKGPLAMTSKNNVGPRDGLSHLVWAAEDLGLGTTKTCKTCGGAGTMPAPVRAADLARALTGRRDKSGAGVQLLKVSADPPLSMIRRAAKTLDLNLEQAAKWIGQLHEAEKVSRSR